MNEKNAKEGFFGRLMEWNNKTYIAIACVASLITGASQPTFGGILMSRILAQLTVPLELYPVIFPGKNMEDEINMYCLIMGLFAVGTWLSMFTQKYFFNKLSEVVTYRMRGELYDAILGKNIGWFDLRENSVGILSSAMA